MINTKSKFRWLEGITSVTSNCVAPKQQTTYNFLNIFLRSNQKNDWVEVGTWTGRIPDLVRHVGLKYLH